MAPRRRQRHVRLAISEATLGMVAGMGWYYSNLQHNAYNLDYNWGDDTFKKKLVTFQGVRFDDNSFLTNTISHPLAATGWYLLFRGNRLSPVESFLLTLAYSTFWELFVEYREVTSINDLVVTPMGGLTLGEPMVQTSAFLRAGSPGLAGRIVAFVLNPLESINSTLEGTRPYGEEPSDPYGVPLAYPHTLEFQVGAANARFAGNGDRGELLFGGRAEVDTRADLPVPGRDHRLVGPGALDRIFMAFALARVEGITLDEVDVGTKVSLMGGLMRAAEGPDDAFVASTRRFFYGLGSGFEYATRERPGQFQDLLGLAKILGPMLDWRFANPRYRLHLSADALYTFGAVGAWALPAYSEANGLVGLPSIITLHGYYYGQGVSASARAVLDIGRWELGATLTEDDFWWFGHHDRYPGVGPAPATWDRRFDPLGPDRCAAVRAASARADRPGRPPAARGEHGGKPRRDLRGAPLGAGRRAVLGRGRRARRRAAGGPFGRAGTDIAARVHVDAADVAGGEHAARGDGTDAGEAHLLVVADGDPGERLGAAGGQDVHEHATPGGAPLRSRPAAGDQRVPDIEGRPAEENAAFEARAQGDVVEPQRPAAGVDAHGRGGGDLEVTHEQAAVGEAQGRRSGSRQERRLLTDDRDLAGRAGESPRARGHGAAQDDHVIGPGRQ